MIVFDLTRKETFNKIKSIVKELKNKAEADCVCYLVGNKLDLVKQNPQLRQVTQEEALKLAANFELVYLETSAKDNLNVNEVFESLVEGIYRVRKEVDEAEEVDLSKHQLKYGNDKEDKCC